MSRHSKHPRYTYTKGNIYYFSRSVPADLRCFYLKPRITQSLRTNSQSRATTASKVFASKLDDYWLGLRLKRLDVPAAHLLVVDPSTKLSSLPTIEEALETYGAEALLRWKHPSLGIVSPLDFIPLAENSGLIIPIGNWVIKTACRQIQEWQKNPKTSGLTVAINISPRQFFQTNFVNEVLEALEETGINSSLLKFEITEGLILDDVDSAIIKMKKLKRRGVEFSLDDFGTGYSSLAYLTRLPLSQLKIDQSFVSGIGHNARPSIIIKTIIAMSKNLGLEVVAEGVETKAQFDFPEPLGCELYQGYLFSKPMPALEFEDALA